MEAGSGALKSRGNLFALKRDGIRHGRSVQCVARDSNADSLFPEVSSDSLTREVVR